MLPFKPHILIADDDPDDRECYRDSFTFPEPSLQLTLVETGTRLLNTLHNDKDRLPSLIVLDNLLPDMNGENLLILLKKDDRYRSIPVIVISGSCTPERSRYLVSLGAVQCIEKPVSVAAWKDLAGQLVQLAKPAGNTTAENGPGA